MLDIVVLCDNYTAVSGCKAEHGFALYLKYQDTALLFDTGQSDVFLSNARHMNIDLSKVAHCVISHGHYDHTGGLQDFITCNSTADIWMHETAGYPRYNSKGDYVGIPENLVIPGSRSVDRLTAMANGIYLLPAVPVFYDTDTHFEQFSSKGPSGLVPDHFSDEQSLVLTTSEGLVIVSGCSHRGICNIIRASVEHFQLPVHLVLGGFHLNKENDLTDFIKTLRQFQIHNIGIAHCTGLEQYCRIASELDSRVFYCGAGTNLSF